jgi:hypothetical protein
MSHSPFIGIAGCADAVLSLPDCGIAMVTAMIMTQKADFSIYRHGFNPVVTVRLPGHSLGYGTSDEHRVGDPRGAPGSAGALDRGLFIYAGRLAISGPHL